MATSHVIVGKAVVHILVNESLSCVIFSDDTGNIDVSESSQCVGTFVFLDATMKWYVSIAEVTGFSPWWVSGCCILH